MCVCVCMSVCVCIYDYILCILLPDMTIEGHCCLDRE